MYDNEMACLHVERSVGPDGSASCGRCGVELSSEPRRAEFIEFSPRAMALKFEAGVARLKTIIERWTRAQPAPGPGITATACLEIGVALHIALWGEKEARQRINEAFARVSEHEAGTIARWRRFV